MLSDLRYRFRALFRRREMERELEEELRFHLERQRQKYLHEGQAIEQADRSARLDFGGVSQVREECRRARGTEFWESAVQDLRHAWRGLCKSPGFALVAVLSLALGIGANAAVFSLVELVLLRSLPVRNPGDLVVISSSEADSSANDTFSYPMYQDIRDKNTVLDGVLARGGTQVNLAHDGQNEHVRCELVSGNYFDVLGVRPFLGRLFTQDDDRVPGESPFAVLSHSFWTARFGRNPAIIGRSIVVNGQALTVVGVTPPGFYGIDLSDNPDLRVPMMMTPFLRPLPANRLQNRHWNWLTMMARRKGGIPLEQAQSSLEVLFRQIRESEVRLLSPDTSAAERREHLSRRIRLAPGYQGFQWLRRELRDPLVLLCGVTGIVLLILCANLANLLVARASARSREVALRQSLGASRSRVLRQWLTESVLLSLLGGGLGIGLASWARSALVAFMPAGSRPNLSASIDWNLPLATLAFSLVAGLLIGLIPAVRAARTPVLPGLRGETPNVAARGGLLTLRGGLVLLQVALSLPLLIGAGLFVRSLNNVQGIDRGFASENVLLASLNPALNGYSEERIRAFHDHLLAEIRALPGVRAASLAWDSPISGGWNMTTVSVEGYQPRDGEDMSPNMTVVSADYFRTLQIPVVAGREFDARDVLGAPKVAVINETMARCFFGSRSPIGRKIGEGKVPDIEIVGVVKDAKYVDLREKRVRHFYLPTTQQKRLFGLTLLARTAGEPVSSVGMIRTAAGKLDRQLPLYDVKTLAAQVDESLTRDRLLAWLTGSFGFLATLLAVTGLYGVVAFSVVRRTREVGIRLALGAQRSEILRLILGQTAILVAAGLGLGLGVALAVSSLLESLLYGVKAADPLAYLVAALVLAATAAVAAFLPARRATRVDPIAVLHCD